MQKIRLNTIPASGNVSAVSRGSAQRVPSTRSGNDRLQKQSRGQLAGFLLCLLAFVGCFLFTLTPLIRIPDPAAHLLRALPVGSFLEMASSWIPRMLEATSPTTSASLAFVGLLTLAFLCYGASVWIVGYQGKIRNQSVVRRCIWLGTLLAGGIFLVTPALLSHDIWVYAGYSRLLAVYHANPYFVTLSSFPRDPLAGVDQWGQTNALYGPVWILVCGLFGWLLGPDPISYVIAFRVLALAAHLLNTWLVGRTLHTMGRSPRTVTMGMLLYAWNPLVLMESSLNGHNDGFMVTFLLLGILLAVRAERQDHFLQVRGFVPPIVAFTLAALVKFTCLPILVAYLLLLVCKALRPTAAHPHAWRQALAHWPRAALVLGFAGGTALIVALVLYGPFWIGHSLPAISGSFTKNAAASWAENSFLRAIMVWANAHPEQQHNPLVAFLSRRQVWDDLTLLGMALCFLMGAPRLWRQPTASMFLALALTTMSLLLLLTPWFFPWYLTWIVGLTALCIPKREARMMAALCILAFTFSLCALTVYLPSGELLGAYGPWGALEHTLPPVAAFLLAWGRDLVRRNVKQRESAALVTFRASPQEVRQASRKPLP